MMREENDKHLRNKINSLEYIPGEPFDKDKAWQRLAAKLPSEKKRMLIWRPYGIAAGLLLLVVTGYYLLPRGGEAIQTVHKNVPANTSPSIPPVIGAAPYTDAVIVSKPVIRPKYLHPGKPATVTNSAKPLPEDIPAVAEVTEPVLLIQPEKVKTEQKHVAAVHINELGDEPIKQPEIPKDGFIAKVYAASGTSAKPNNSTEDNKEYGLLNLGINR